MATLLSSSGRLLIMIIVALLLVEKVHCFGISSTIQRIKSKSQGKQIRQATSLQAQLQAVTAVKRGGAVSLVAGKLFAGFSKLAVDVPTAMAIWKELAKQLQYGDVILIAALAWGTIPLTKLIHRAIFGQDSSNNFLKSNWSNSADFVSEGAKVAGLVFSVDVLTIVLHGLKFRFASTYPWSHWAAKILYTVWAALRLAKVKRYFVYQSVRRNSRIGQAIRSKAAIYDKSLNLLILFTTTFLLLDFLSVETGVVSHVLLTSTADFPISHILFHAHVGFEFFLCPWRYQYYCHIASLQGHRNPISWLPCCHGNRQVSPRRRYCVGGWDRRECRKGRMAAYIYST
jgi:hypothetical protein